MQANSFYRHVNKTYDTLESRIQYFEENYEPTNLSVSGNLSAGGNASLGGNVTIGSNTSDIININGEVTFNGEVTGNIVQFNTLTVIDNTVIGDDNEDTLEVNSNTSFNGNVTFHNHFNVTGNAVFGSDTTNNITSNGNIVAPHFEIPTTSGNSFKTGSNETIVYVEYSDNANIFEEYPRSVIVTVKNVHDTPIEIFTDNSEGSNVQFPFSTAIYLKTSDYGYTTVYGGTNLG